jgi:hypothetical protein
MKYKEGIDRVGVLLNPMFFRKENINKHKDPFRRLTLHNAGQWHVLSIHEEWFNPFFDYQMQIALAVYELVKEGVVDFMDNMFTPYFIYRFHEWFILSIVGVEFYSDFKDKNINVDKNMLKPSINEAKEEGCLYQFYDKAVNKLTDTFYSPDKNGTRKSQFIVYNKLEKSIKDNNHASVETLIKYQNPIRCEFKIYSNNSNWLHWDNLLGDYQTIFNRYKNYLAVIFNNYIDGCLTVKGDENNNFINIVKTAKTQNMIRFSNVKKRLKRKNILSEDSFDNDKLDEFKMDSMEIFNNFIQKSSIKRASGIFNKKASNINIERDNIRIIN